MPPLSQTRPPAAAGRFYPDDPKELRELINHLLAQASPSPGPAPKAIIAPHAGYLFSGPVAASAYSALLPDRDLIKRVVLLGPSHFVACDLVAATKAEAFETPLGSVPVDLEAIRSIQSLPQVGFLDEAHQDEHSLEVQLPFLQILLPQFTLVPLVVGDVPPECVARVIESLWDGPETCFVISSDLSHYLDSPSARKMDAATASAIERLDTAALHENCACGFIPLQGLLLAASSHRLGARTLDLRNSGDTGGPRKRVVGYGAFAFAHTPAPARRGS